MAEPPSSWADTWAYPPPLPPQPPRRRVSRGVVIVLVLAIVVPIAGFGLLAAAAFTGRVIESADELSGDEANCRPLVTKPAPAFGMHVPVGEPVEYPDAPPAFGSHWGNVLVGTELRTFYTTADRPPVERLVHSLEHGYTILWYDAAVVDNSEELDRVRHIAEWADLKFIAAPWTAADGPAFPLGTHIALTHWMAGESGETTGESTAARAAEESTAYGVWGYCQRPSLDVVDYYMDHFPWTSAPEPNGA